MHHIDPTELPLRLAQHGIYRRNDEPRPLQRDAIPALPHWEAARPTAPRNESQHDFLVLGLLPE